MTNRGVYFGQPHTWCCGRPSACISSDFITVLGLHPQAIDLQAFSLPRSTLKACHSTAQGNALGILLGFLRDPASYPYAPPQVDLIQTHISVVAIAPPYVYKVKKLGEGEREG